MCACVYIFTVVATEYHYWKIRHTTHTLSTANYVDRSHRDWLPDWCITGKILHMHALISSSTYLLKREYHDLAELPGHLNGAEHSLSKLLGDRSLDRCLKGTLDECLLQLLHTD